MKENKDAKKQKNIFITLWDGFLRIEKYLPVMILSALLVLLTISVFLRFVVGKPLSWTDEYAQYLFGWLIFSSAAYAANREQHITINILDAFVPHKIMKIFELIGRIIWIIFGMFFTYNSLIYTINVFVKGQKGVSFGGIPLGFIYMAIPIGFGLMTLHSALHLKYWQTNFIEENTEKEELL